MAVIRITDLVRVPIPGAKRGEHLLIRLSTRKDYVGYLRSSLEEYVAAEKMLEQYISIGAGTPSMETAPCGGWSHDIERFDAGPVTQKKINKHHAVALVTAQRLANERLAILKGKPDLFRVR